jgi:hypothetical protein
VNTKERVTYRENDFKNALEIQLRGNEDDGEDVRLSAFINQLKSLQKILHSVDYITSGKDQPLFHHKLINLSHNSPATIVLSPVPANPKNNYISSSIYERLLSYIKIIKNQDIIPPELTREFLENLIEFVNRLNKNFIEITIAYKDQIIKIEDTLKEKIEKILEQDTVSYGSVKGMLETINVHGENHFYLYPIVGGDKIKCLFEYEHFELVKKALKMNVVVTGKLFYKSIDVYPYKVEVEELEINPPHDELPTLRSLFGSAPQATGPMTTQEYIRKIREGW